MADNVELNAMSGGAIVASDEVAAAQVQIVKIMHGADGANDGLVDNASPLPVTAVVASGGIASGAVASGAVASGAIASGAIAAGAVAAGAVVSGAVLAGAIATGAIVDLPAKGQAAMAASVPVAIANNQSAVPISIASAQVASGAIASGAVASGAIASGAVASGAIAAGAIAAGDTSIATTEDTARAAGEHLVKIGVSRLDTPVANANVNADGDYTNITTDNKGKVWVSGTSIEDEAEVAGMSLTMCGGVRRDTKASSAATDGDCATMNLDATGGLWTDPQGNVAHDATDSGNPIKIGFKCETTPSAQVVVDTDRSDAICDADGALFTRPGALIGDFLTESVSNTNGNATAFAVFTTGASVRNVITDIVAYNTSATAGYVIITDGIGGTTLMNVPLPAGGGAVINLTTPIKSTANTALYFDVSGALTTVYITVTGYRTKVP